LPASSQACTRPSGEQRKSPEKQLVLQGTKLFLSLFESHSAGAGQRYETHFALAKGNKLSHWLKYSVELSSGCVGLPHTGNKSPPTNAVGLQSES
jgi:hypothetical protein